MRLSAAGGIGWSGSRRYGETHCEELPAMLQYGVANEGEVGLETFNGATGAGAKPGEHPPMVDLRRGVGAKRKLA